jgi:phospholipid/cholesterol/gamma-HCH transport system substrate-binding protein
MKPFRERNPIAVGIVGVVLLTAIGLLAYFSDQLPFIGGGTTYTADFSEAAGLRSGNEVRVAGVMVGNVTDVSLDRNHVKVTFKVKGAWIGDSSTAAIKIRTLLGEKYLAIDPLGRNDQDPGKTIPVNRTVAPYDVTQAFNDLASTVGSIDTNQLAQAFESISSAFGTTAPDVKSALTGLAAVSQSIATRDNQLSQLLSNTKSVTGVLAADTAQFQLLLSDGSQLLSEVQARRDAIHTLLTGTEALSQQLAGLVNDNNAQIGPALAALDQVTNTLQANQDNLNKALSLAGPYYRMLGNTVGNGRWLDSYICGLIPQTASGCVPPKPGGH